MCIKLCKFCKFLSFAAKQKEFFDRYKYCYVVYILQPLCWYAHTVNEWTVGHVAAVTQNTVGATVDIGYTSAYHIDYVDYSTDTSHACNRGKWEVIRDVTIFLPRDAIHKRGLCRRAVSVCLSVRPSRTRILSTRISVSSIFSPLDSHTVIVFSVPNVMAIFRRGPPPPNAALNAGG